jgi:hypothetical protein
MAVSLFPIPRRLWRAFLVGAMFFAPFDFSLLEFCAGVFAGQNFMAGIYLRGCNRARIIVTK